MVQNGTGLTWTPAREQAAVLVAEDRVSDEEIAAEVGIGRNTLSRWKRYPDFRARVEELRNTLRSAIVVEGIANRQNRIDALDERWKLLSQIIKERGADDSMTDVAGGKTGLLVATPMWVKVTDETDDGEQTGRKQSQLVYKYQTDTALLAELRAHEQQAAQELGQWTEKRELTGDAPIQRVIILDGDAGPPPGMAPAGSGELVVPGATA